jgi:hypothetical protein
MVRPIFLAAACAALCTGLLPGCITDNAAEGVPAGASVVKFQTSIAKTTRATDGVWEYGDRIGVYMIPADTAPEDWDEDKLHAGNKRYETDLNEGENSSRVVFAGADPENTIEWPGKGQTFDFIAYYPWREDISDGYVYQIDVSRQTPQRDIDLMWSNNVKGQNSGSPTLKFQHKLSKLVFNVVDETGAPLEGMTASVEGLPAKAGFSLRTGKIIEGTELGGEEFAAQVFFNDAEPARAVVEAIVLPGENLEDFAVTFSLADGAKALFKVAETDFLPGKRYIYDIALTESGDGEATFGVNGDPDQIDLWEEGDVGDYPGEIRVINPGNAPGGEASGPWLSGFLDVSDDFNVEGGSLEGDDYEVRAGNNMIIIKPGCDGVVSVTITGAAGNGVIRSVKVGDHDLVAATDHSQKSLAFSNRGDYTFLTPDGKSRSGDLRIIIEATGLVSVEGFGTNLP